MGYHYPIDSEWTRQEIIDVVEFLNIVEKAYESKVGRDDVLMAYNKFKHVVPSKGEEKRLFSKFEKESGYSGYHLIKKARETEQSIIKMK